MQRKCFKLCEINVLCMIVGMSGVSQWCRYLAAEGSKLRERTQKTLSFQRVISRCV